MKRVPAVAIVMFLAGAFLAKAALTQAPQHGSFSLRSAAVGADGVLPKTFTGDGEAVTPPLEWRGEPAGTKSFAIAVHHVDPQGVTKSYWVLYDIPAGVHRLAQGAKGVGRLGTNSINDRAEYAPPHSKGPGPKRYTFTVYALSAAPPLELANVPVTRDVLLAAIKGRTLGAAQMEVTYTRPDDAGRDDERPAGGRGRGEPGRGGKPQPGRPGDGGGRGTAAPNSQHPPGQRYSIEQAISDEAQLHTIAFSGLAFITGEFGAATFLPPGKVCDFFGFQYMRDIDEAAKGHNPIFLDRVAGNVLSILSAQQRTLFETAARQEALQWRGLAEKRFPVIKAFYRQLASEVPKGSAGLDERSVGQYLGELFAADAEISYRRADLFARVASALTPDGKARLARMKFGDFNTWPEVDMEAYKLPRGTEKLVNVAYMTYASEFFSWYAGSITADTYFCPERHGTYFGAFYMKDMPAMGKRDYDISTAETGDRGRAFLDGLTPSQRGTIEAIPNQQRRALARIVEVRRAIAVELRKFLAGQVPDRTRVVALGREYGELDAQVSYCYATAFSSVNRTLTPEQRRAFLRLRNLAGYTPAPAYIYSDPIEREPLLPATDRFFFPPK